MPSPASVALERAETDRDCINKYSSNHIPTGILPLMHWVQSRWQSDRNFPKILCAGHHCLLQSNAWNTQPHFTLFIAFELLVVSSELTDTSGQSRHFHHQAASFNMGSASFMVQNEDRRKTVRVLCGKGSANERASSVTRIIMPLTGMMHIFEMLWQRLDFSYEVQISSQVDKKPERLLFHFAFFEQEKATFSALFSLMVGCSVVAIFLLSAQKLA